MTQAAPKIKAAGKWPYVVLAFGLLIALASSDGLGFGIALMAIGGMTLGVRLMATRRANEAAQKLAHETAEAARAEAAAKADHEAEVKRQADEEERRFQAEQKTMTETAAYQRLHSQVNELLDYANRLKRDGDNKMVLQATMEVIGRIAMQHDLEARFFEHEGIREDTRLFFAQLKRAGLQNDMVYQRAVRVLRYQPPESTPLRAVG